jgi:serine/threonine protein kinase
VLATDGVYEHVAARFIVKAIGEAQDHLDTAAQAIVEQACRNGSEDNLTIQIVRIDEIPDAAASEIVIDVERLPLPPLLDARAVFDGYRIIREIHASHRSHIYLAADTETDAVVALKIPSMDQRDDLAYLRRFLMEEWITRRIDSPYVLKPFPPRPRNYLYVVTEFIDGQTLTQWMIDNPRPDLETVRGIVEQIARGLRAFHRKEMLHQDLRPANIMIDKTGTVKIIDFGSVAVAGVTEGARDAILGTQQYTAPEYFLGEAGTPRSELFSLGVITYQMLTGKLPYGAQAARVRTKAQLRKLAYRSALDDDREIPAWIDGALARAVHPDPQERYESLSEYLFDLRHPNAAYLGGRMTPLIERNPLLFWKATSLALVLVIIAMLAGRHAGRW